MNRLLQYFQYDHLPEPMREASQPFHSMAHYIDKILPDNPEKTEALRKLLESKDCAVRSLFFKAE